MLQLCREHGIPCREGDFSLAELYRADEAFCTGTMGELTPIVEVDGRTIGRSDDRPLLKRLTAFFRELTANTGDVVVDN